MKRLMSSLRSLIAKPTGDEGTTASGDPEPAAEQMPDAGTACQNPDPAPTAAAPAPAAAERAGAATLQQMLDLLGIEAAVGDPQQIDDGVLLEVQSMEAGRLIGRGGLILQSLQFLLNRIAQRTIDPGAPRFVIDVDGYRHRLQEKLVRQARQAADRVRRWGEPVVLEPMTAYERRIVHTALKQDPDVETWSPAEADPDGLKQITVRLIEPAADESR